MGPRPAENAAVDNAAMASDNAERFVRALADRLLSSSTLFTSDEKLVEAFDEALCGLPPSNLKKALLKQKQPLCTLLQE